MAEQTVDNRQVLGSTPGVTTTLIRKNTYILIHFVVYFDAKCSMIVSQFSSLYF
jgi:hypothetical protein